MCSEYTLCVKLYTSLKRTHLLFDLMSMIVISITANRTGDVSNRSNHRPISLATTVTKVIDSVPNSYLDKHLQLRDSQFRFQSGILVEDFHKEIYWKRIMSVNQCGSRRLKYKKGPKKSTIFVKRFYSINLLLLSF